MTTSITLSIIIATFNSHKTLERVLLSIEKQTYPKKNIEILLLDGGSKDDTVKIGKKFHCTIIHNPQTEPVHAKYLGLLKARGKYILYLDHDEVLENEESLSKKISVLEENDNIKAVIGSGYKNPPGYPFINEYINEFGDPFSFFIYRISKNYLFFLKDLQKEYMTAQENQNYLVVDFSQSSQLPLIELCAGGSMFDASYVKQHFPQVTKNQQYIPHIFYLLVQKKPQIAVAKHDALIHYSSESLKGYLNKIRWRIKNNIYHASGMGEAGFTGRERYLHGWEKYKRYFFLPYAYSIICPLLDSLILIITRRKLRYIAHLPLTLYTANLIVYHYFLKLIGYRPALRSYDETKEITKG